MNESNDGLDLDIEEPILEAFPIMVEAAECYCRPAGKSEICYVYHRLWPYRRLAGAAKRELGRAAPIIHALRTVARESRLKRVLISGSADYALLARVVHACRAEGIEPEVTVLDLCEAPLHINRWYAKRIGADVRTVCSDVCRFEAEAPFDAVVTDVFLTRIPPEQRPLVARTWRDALRVGGVVVTKEPVSSEFPSGTRRVSEAEVDAKVAAISRRLEPHGDLIPIDGQELETYVRAYFSAQLSYPFGSPGEIRALFESNGFEIETLEVAVRPYRRDHPEFWKRNSHAIVARRRE